MFGFLKLETVDIVFLVCAFVVALVLVLISNPLTSWVNRMVNKNKNQD
jgi:hypothetical protein